MNKRTPMRSLDPHMRMQSFEEVNLGYNSQEAITEAERCLSCKTHPCISGCPVNIDIPTFIKQIAKGEFENAYQTITQSSSLPAVCGRVCPQETQCELACVLNKKNEPIAIGYLERFAADYHRLHSVQNNHVTKEPNGYKIAVIGSGPAGISCAYDLALAGCMVDLFEALHETGGVLTYGIPAFRLPKDVVSYEVEQLKHLGVQIKPNVIIGKTLMIQDLFDMGYHSVFIGTGAGLPRMMGIPGEMLNGVYSANEYLTRVNLMKAYESHSLTPVHRGKKVAVIGGGNVALDAARSALRLGADDVYIIYRRSEKELPSRLEEIEHAKQEGIQFKFLTQIKGLSGNAEGFVNRMHLVKMILGEPDESGRRRPIEDPHTSFDMDIDEVIFAIGTSPNPLIFHTSDLASTSHGCVIIDEKGKTSLNHIYAGGDVVSGSATVILAMEAGRKAAKSILESITS